MSPYFTFIGTPWLHNSRDKDFHGHSFWEVILADMLLPEDKKLFDSGLHNQCSLDKDGVDGM